MVLIVIALNQSHAIQYINIAASQRLVELLNLMIKDITIMHSLKSPRLPR